MLLASLGLARGTDGEPVPKRPDVFEILAQVAWVQAVTTVCRDDTPEVSGHLIQAYEEWWERNTVIQEALHALEFGPDPAIAAENRDLFRSLKVRALRIFTEKQETDPVDFARQSETFTKELAAGEWDYPRGQK